MTAQTIGQSPERSDVATDNVASDYIHDHFESTDRLALLLVSRDHGGVIQRIATAEKMAERDFQQWLRFVNSRRYEVYLSMNALNPHATGRTKADIATIRHIYLDLDEGGPKALERLLERTDLPKPNTVIESSPGKCQVIWRVDGFTQDQAEGIQRALVRETGADPAATDSSRVLRLPGFFNHKYDKPHRVTAQSISDRVSRPEDFPEFSPEQLAPIPGERHRPGSHVSQSERDWAYAMRALARGDPEDQIIDRMARFRSDKPNPQYYAEHTVRKAATVFRKRQRSRTPPARGQPER